MEAERVAILGLGGGGGKIVAELAAGESLGANVQLAVADTDRRALEKLGRVIQIPLGVNWTRDDGCGGNATLGEKSAIASTEDLLQFLEGARLTVVVAGLGGGTGSGASRVVARLLRQNHAASLFAVSLPFAFEGNWRCHQAEKDLDALRALTDAVMPIPNDLLFTSLPPDTPAARAFEVANSVLAEGISGLTRLTQAVGILTVDFAALRALLRERPSLCSLGVGHGSGPDRWKDVVREFMACPLIGGPETLDTTDAAVLSLIGGTELSVGEMQSCLSSLQQQFPPHAKILVGASSDPCLQDEVLLTGLICRYRSQPQNVGAAQSGLPGGKSAAGAASGRKTGRRKQGADADGRQIELPLLEQALGIFSGSSPTTFDGENLDIPTFQRRGVYIDAGL